MMGHEKDKGCPKSETPMGVGGCEGDGAYHDVYPYPGKAPYPAELEMDKDHDGGDPFDVPDNTRRRRHFHTDHGAGGMLNPFNAAKMFKGAFTSDQEGVDPKQKHVSMNADGTSSQTDSSAYGYGDGDGDKGYEDLGEAPEQQLGRRSTPGIVNHAKFNSTLHAAVMGLSASSVKHTSEIHTRRSVPRVQDGRDVRQTRHPGGRGLRFSETSHRTQRGWHTKHARYIVDNAVTLTGKNRMKESRLKTQRANFASQGQEEELRKVDRWLGEITHSYARDSDINERKSKWSKMSPEQQQELLTKHWNSLSPAQQKAQKRADKTQKKIDAHFAAHGMKQKYTKVHSLLGIHPFQRLHGPLPMGWHVGHSKASIRYYWNDSGAKQMHLPTAPYLGQVYKMSEDTLTREQLQGNVSQGLQAFSDLNNFNYSAPKHTKVATSTPKAAETASPQRNTNLRPTNGKNASSRPPARDLSSELAVKANFAAP